jgi:hypothetical protein
MMVSLPSSVNPQATLNIYWHYRNAIMSRSLNREAMLPRADEVHKYFAGGTRVDGRLAYSLLAEDRLVNYRRGSRARVNWDGRTVPRSEDDVREAIRRVSGVENTSVPAISPQRYPPDIVAPVPVRPQQMISPLLHSENEVDSAQGQEHPGASRGGVESSGGLGSSEMASYAQGPKRAHQGTNSPSHGSQPLPKRITVRSLLNDRPKSRGPR